MKVTDLNLAHITCCRLNHFGAQVYVNGSDISKKPVLCGTGPNMERKRSYTLTCSKPMPGNRVEVFIFEIIKKVNPIAM